MEKKLRRLFDKESKRIEKEWEAYMMQANKDLLELEEERFTMRIKGEDTKDIDKKIKDAKIDRTLKDKRYKAMLDKVTNDLARVNVLALSYINENMPPIYKINYNQIGEQTAVLGIDFTLLNDEMLNNLIEEDKVDLPHKTLNKYKDKAWNMKQLNSSLLQGIIQGESMQKIAKRIIPIVNNNKESAIRNARTMTTSAENRGRYDSYHTLQNKGIVMLKEWVSTDDSRTRQAHVALNGQIRQVDDNFVDGNGKELEYPADPKASPETVYNCRCTMVGRIQGFKGKKGVTWV